MAGHDNLALTEDVSKAGREKHNWLGKSQGALVHLLKQTGLFNSEQGTAEVYEDLPMMYISEAKNACVFLEMPEDFYPPACFLECFESDAERGEQQGLYRADIIVRIAVIFGEEGTQDYTRRNSQKKLARQYLTYIQRWLFSLDSNRSNFSRLMSYKSDGTTAEDLLNDIDAPNPATSYCIPDFKGLEVIKRSEGSIYNFALERAEEEVQYERLVLLLASSVGLKFKYADDLL